MSEAEIEKRIAAAIKPFEARIAELERQVLYLKNPQLEIDERERIAREDFLARHPGGFQSKQFG